MKKSSYMLHVFDMVKANSCALYSFTSKNKVAQSAFFFQKDDFGIDIEQSLSECVIIYLREFV